jgi:hypothetical protein
MRRHSRKRTHTAQTADTAATDRTAESTQRLPAGGIGPALTAFLLLSLAGLGNARIINTLRAWSPLEQGWTLEAQGTISRSTGNSEHMSLSAAGSAQLLLGRNRFRFLISETYREVDGKRSAEDFSVHLRHNWRITGPIHTLLFAQSEYDPFRRLRRRTLLGGGLRADLLRDSTAGAAVGASAMLESEELTDSPEDGKGTRARGSFFLSLVWKPAPGSALDLSGFYQPKLTEPADRLMLGAATLEAELFEGLSLLTALKVSYDSDPPDDVETTDTSLSSGLKLSL